MTSLSSRIAMLAPFTRSIAIAALMGTTILAIPLTAARADSTTKAAIQLAQAATPKTPVVAAATETKGETVEQRITTLHAALKITSDEDTKWNAVAQAMRENATAMDKLIAETRTTPPQNMTAVDDLKMYQRFSEEHVTGLKNTTSVTMPAVAPRNGAVAAAIRNERPMPAAQVAIVRLARRRSTSTTAGNWRNCTVKGTAARRPIARLLAPSSTRKPVRNTPAVSAPMASLASAS
jgi:periplasmic protein CpxP/Spy